MITRVPSVSVVELEPLLAKVRKGSRQYVTNFFVAPNRWGDWLRRGVQGQLSDDRVLLLIRKEEACQRIFFAGDRMDVVPALAEAVFPSDKPVVIDLIGHSADTTRWAQDMRDASFRPHLVLRRLSRTGGMEAASPEALAQISGGETRDVDPIFQMMRRDFDPFTDQIPDREEMGEAISSGAVRIIRDGGGAVAGFLWWERAGVTATIRYWCVDRSFRGKGYGSALMKDYFTLAAGCVRHLLWLRENNSTASACYVHYGYAPDGLEDLVMVGERKNI